MGFFFVQFLNFVHLRVHFGLVIVSLMNLQYCVIYDFRLLENVFTFCSGSLIIMKDVMNEIPSCLIYAGFRPIKNNLKSRGTVMKFSDSHSDKKMSKQPRKQH